MFFARHLYRQKGEGKKGKGVAKGDRNAVKAVARQVVLAPLSHHPFACLLACWLFSNNQVEEEKLLMRKPEALL